MWRTLTGLTCTLALTASAIAAAPQAVGIIDETRGGDPLIMPLGVWMGDQWLAGHFFYAVDCRTPAGLPRAILGNEAQKAVFTVLRLATFHTVDRTARYAASYPVVYGIIDSRYLGLAAEEREPASAAAPKGLTVVASPAPAYAITERELDALPYGSAVHERMRAAMAEPVRRVQEGKRPTNDSYFERSKELELYNPALYQEIEFVEAREIDVGGREMMLWVRLERPYRKDALPEDMILREDLWRQHYDALFRVGPGGDLSPVWEYATVAVYLSPRYHRWVGMCDVHGDQTYEFVLNESAFEYHAFGLYEVRDGAARRVGLVQGAL